MTTDVLRLQGNYLIQTTTNGGGSNGGVVTIDVGGGPGGASSTGTVIVRGNLVVLGTQTNLVTTNASIKDNTITLNSGEIGNGPNPTVTAGTSGIKIARGINGQDQDQYAAFLEWNEERSWQGTGAISNIAGIWEFRVGRTGRPQYGAIRVNAIRIDENSASTAGAGAGQGSRLNIFGSDNPTSVISVSGTNNYESRVTDPDDIPNKAYVDNLITSPQAEAEKLVVGKSYVTLTDTFNDAVTSEIIGVLNGDPDEDRTNITTGTIVMRITESVAQFSGVQFVGNEILPTGADEDLILSTDGTGQIILAAPLLFESGNPPVPGVGETGLYVGESAGGGTGVFFVKKDLLGDVTSDEFISRKKSLIYSIIFG